MQERPTRIGGIEGGAFGLTLAPLSFLAVFYIVPLLGVVGVSLFPGGSFSLNAYLALFESDTFLSIVWRTIRLSLQVAFICLLLGYPYAYFLNKVDGWKRQVLLLFVVMPFFTSVLIRSYAWVALLGPRGIVNKALLSVGLIDQPITLVYNEIGALIGMSQVQLPLMILTLYGSMRRIDMQLVRAAEGLGAHGLVAFSKVFLPLSAPGIAAGFGLVFTSTLGFYVTPALLGGASEYMVTQSIFVQLNNLNDFSGAAAQATVLLVIILALLSVLRNVIARTDGPATKPGIRGMASLAGVPEAIVHALGGGATFLLLLLRGLSWLVVLAVAVFLMITMITVIPLGFSADAYLRFPPSGFSMQWIEAYLGNSDWLGSTWFSVWISLGGAAVATFFASIAAYGLTRMGHTRSKPLLELVFISPMIVPQFVVALALYFIFIKLGLVGSVLPYIVCYGVFGFPYAFLVMHAAFQRFDISVVQAAANLGAGVSATWGRIIVPLLLPSFLSAAGFAFLTAFDDLIVALFFSSGGQYTLPMRMWADIRNEISPQIAAVAVVFFGSALLTVVAARLVRKAVSIRNGAPAGSGLPVPTGNIVAAVQPTR